MTGQPRPGGPAGSRGNPCLSHACSACCHDTAMPLREADVARLRALGHDPARFARAEDGWLLLRNERGACVFLRGGTCAVYEARPEGCRLYPLVWEEHEDPGLAAGPALDELCPWRAEFAPGPGERRRLDALVRVLVREREARAGAPGGGAGAAGAAGGGGGSDRRGPAGFK